MERQIEFDKVKEMWAERAVTRAAKEKIAEFKIILDEKELRKELRDTTDGKEMIEKLGTPPLQDVSEILEILKIAGKGDCLTPYQLERVKSVLIILDRLGAYLRRGQQFQNSIAYFDESLNSQNDLREEISAQIQADNVADRASKYLFDIRMNIIHQEDMMKQKAEQIIRNNSECMADRFYTWRNGRVCIPVKKEYRYKIPGAVIDRSNTGSTVFVEPEGVAKLGEELQLMRIDEENEVYRILYTLTAMVADRAESLMENMKLIETLDFIFSKAKLSVDLHCVEPEINAERRIVLQEAKHPLMDPVENVPLTFELGSAYRGVVITGPNTGGKTVAIKTVMLNAVMAQCGLHVCAKKANICMNSAYFCDIGDGQNLSENLSTFSAHIKNVLGILKEMNEESFVIMDELGSGTDPAEGMGIAIAILEKLRESRANFLVTTHYPEVKEYAEKKEDIVNARMTFDRETLQPTYRMVIGEAGESCAFYIADRLGMPEEMLKTAVAAAYGEAAVDTYSFGHNVLKKSAGAKKLKKAKAEPGQSQLAVRLKFSVGDSVMVYPDKKIGIVCEPVNEKGFLQVQVAKRKFWINHKRVKLRVKAEELYPEDYDMSIVFDTVENRKKRHDMSRKYTEEVIVYEKDEKQ